MTESALISAIAKRTGKNKEEVKDIINAFKVITQEQLKEKNKVQLFGFGTFENRTRKECKGRNPAVVGEIIPIPEHQRPFFKSSPKLKRVLRD